MNLIYLLLKKISKRFFKACYFKFEEKPLIRGDVNYSFFCLQNTANFYKLRFLLKMDITLDFG